MMLKIVIPDKPIAKTRPRFSRRGNFVNTYSDQQEKSDAVKLLLKQQMKYNPPLEGALYFRAVFFMPIPKHTSRKKRLAMILGTIQHTKRPDIDNLEKFIADCLNGIVWKDDSQIVHSETFKAY
jgi:Holliday junction resolvase RusA-like endonuclease